MIDELVRRFDGHGDARVASAAISSPSPRSSCASSRSAGRPDRQTCESTRVARRRGPARQRSAALDASAAVGELAVTWAASRSGANASPRLPSGELYARAAAS